MDTLENFLRDHSGRPPYKKTTKISAGVDTWAESVIVAQPVAGHKLYITNLTVYSAASGANSVLHLARMANATTTTVEEDEFPDLSWYNETYPFAPPLQGCPILLEAGKVWRARADTAAGSGMVNILGWELPD